MTPTSVTWPPSATHPRSTTLIGLVQRLDSVLADLRTAADDLAWLVRSGE